MILFQVWPDSENQWRIYWLALTIDWPSRTCLATNAVSRARPPSSGQRLIQGEGWGGCNPPFGKFSNLSGYPCLSLFNTKNNIISYNVSSSQIDRYKNTVGGSEWGGPLVGCRLKFSNFVGSRLKFSIFVGSRLNFSIFAGCRKISVNK